MSINCPVSVLSRGKMLANNKSAGLAKWLLKSAPSLSAGILQDGRAKIGFSATRLEATVQNAEGPGKTANSHQQSKAIDLGSPSAKEAKLESALYKPSCVIFDKDGTLVCFHTMWSPWCTRFAERLSEDTGLDDLDDRVYNVLGYDEQKGRVRIGALAENTHPQIRRKLEHMLHVELGLNPKMAKRIIDRTWQDSPENMSIKLTANLEDLFERLKLNGVKVAICTSDSKQGTAEFLKRQKLEHLVDIVVCGDDPNSKPKPDPHNAYYICEQLGVKPEATVMVGDTPADTLMGQQANLGLTVGVLSGVGHVQDLMDADIIVQDVSRLIDMLLPEGPQTEQKVHHITTRGLSKIVRGSLFFNDMTSDGLSLGCKGGGPNETRRTFTTSSTTTSKNPSFSHIVVGAGSAGCVMANRLTEDSSNKVLLLEAGTKDTILGSRLLGWKIHMPAALMYNLCNDRHNWYYHTEPQPHCNNRRMYWPRGKVWGGSSSLNAMVYMRGHPLDYDRWDQEGADGWSYRNVLPYFKKAQSHEQGPNDYRGGAGPLHVSCGVSGNILHDTFLQACREAGHPLTEDVNGYQQEGFGPFDMTTYKGMRWSTASAYLRPALERGQNRLEVQSKVLVTRVIFDGIRAIGVEYVQNGTAKKAFAEKDVVLSGGAINSPQLLMLSGVGDAAHLKEMDIPLVHHLPGVGQNLQDHLEVYVVQKCKKPASLLKDQKGLRMIRIGVQWFFNQTGPTATSHLESGGFARSRPGIEHPDIMFHFLPSQVIDHGRKAPSLEAYQVHVGPMRPTSRGWLKLKSKNPDEHPLINPNYLATEIDRWEMRESIKLSREIFAQKAFDEYRDIELEPGADADSDEAIDEFVKAKGDSAYHPSCTCKMGDPGKDPMAVVDPTTKVIGLENLRVVDASIMPSVVSGNTNAPVIMLAERAADLIQGKAMLPPADMPIYRPKSLETRR